MLIIMKIATILQTFTTTTNISIFNKDDTTCCDMLVDTQPVDTSEPLNLPWTKKIKITLVVVNLFEVYIYPKS